MMKLEFKPLDPSIEWSSDVERFFTDHFNHIQFQLREFEYDSFLTTQQKETQQRVVINLADEFRNNVLENLSERALAMLENKEPPPALHDYQKMFEPYR